MEELVEYLKKVEHSETKNPPERNDWNNSSSGLKKTKKSKRKCDKDKSPKTMGTALQAIRRATNHTSSARCLVAMLNCIPLANAIK
eukprot:9696259-Ditylum_brightwellii.AAC.1